MAVLASCDGDTYLWENSDQWMRCTTGWYDINPEYEIPTTSGEGQTIVVYQVPPPVDIGELDPTIGGAMYAAGFGLAFAPFFAAYGIRQILSLIR